MLILVAHTHIPAGTVYVSPEAALNWVCVPLKATLQLRVPDQKTGKLDAQSISASSQLLWAYGELIKVAHFDDSS